MGAVKERAIAIWEDYEQSVLNIEQIAEKNDVNVQEVYDVIFMMENDD